MRVAGAGGGLSVFLPPMLILSLLPDTYAICRLPSTDPVPVWAISGALSSVTRSADELSIVCRERGIPDDVVREGKWRCLRVATQLDLSLTGILASLVVPLANAMISVFSLSTYDTDYLLVKADMLDRAIEVLREAGHDVTLN